MVDVGQFREDLLAIKHQQWTFEKAEAWRKELHAEFDAAFQVSVLPDRPDYDAVNQFLIEARQASCSEGLP